MQKGLGPEHTGQTEKNQSQGNQMKRYGTGQPMSREGADQILFHICFIYLRLIVLAHPALVAHDLSRSSAPILTAIAWVTPRLGDEPKKAFYV
jgi:hypothetical protein